VDLNWVFQTAILIGLGAIAWFIKTTFAEIKQRFEKNEAHITKVEESLNALKSDLPFIYTTREDHATAMNAVDRKMTDVDKKLDRLLEYAARERGQKA